MNVPYSITPGAVMVVVGNQPKVVSATHPNYAKLVKALHAPVHDVDLIGDLADILRFVARATFGAVEVGDTGVRWNGKPVVNVIADRMLQMLFSGHDLAPLGKFLDKLMLNPLETAQNELYLWLESGNQPITPDGNILAFKNVRNDYKDIHSGTIDNSIGAQPEMAREDVDPSRFHTCSRGLHFCSFGYLPNFSHAYDGHTMIVEVNPADVVAIPNDYSNQKGRCWTYKVVGEVPAEAAANFFEGQPVVEIHEDDADAEFDASEFEADEDTDVPEFLEDDTVECIKVIFPDVDYSDILTLGDHYTIIDGTDNDDEVFFTGDDGSSWYVPAAAFKLVERDGVPAAVEPEAVEVNTEAPALMFRVKGTSRSILAGEVAMLVANHGQRGAASLLAVPRTTLQGWLKAIAEQHGDC